jgi:hypothetical protein
MRASSIVQLTAVALVAAVGACLTAVDASQGAASGSATANCVAIGTPKPTLSYVHRYSDKSGSTDYTNQWKQMSATGSLLVTTRPGAHSTYVAKHSVSDDVIVLESSTATGFDAGGPFNNSMTYSPGAIGDPAFKACEGKTWTIPAVNATSKSAGGSFSTKTNAGTMRIIKINESVTVPAGTFNTVHYIKTMGQVADEFWKSIDHGITVKRNSVQPGSVATEVLLAIK